MIGKDSSLASTPQTPFISQTSMATDPFHTHLGPLHQVHQPHSGRLVSPDHPSRPS
ncbi:unnamed protein product [Protopolystoma xenopodis]|uniref:Uncharacterized protein n=1 Tax=Protopolystoma xenopodis TaxID=117903 RepID=A0A448WZH1_9PLAT|nr:unnamed protein product [Protopolystoma xenopodis]